MEIRVAIFEDNKTLRESLEQLINNSDGMYCTGAFADANRLERNMHSSSPDVVLMDIQMPGISGIQAASVIHLQFPQVSLLMQTVFEDDDKIFAAICAGASGYLLKKTSPQKIVEAIREAQGGGAPITPSIAARVLQMFRHQSADTRTEFIDLSEREREILALLVKGKSYKTIGVECFVSIDTVSTHVKHIYEKLHVHSKSEAVAKAIRQKLI